MDKKLVIIGGVIILAILIVGGAYLVSQNNAKKAVPTPTPAEQQIFTLKPEDIGLVLSVITSGKFANNGVDMKITKLSDVASVDYELDYTATGGIPRGAIGHVDIKSTTTIIDQQLPFGTCSDVCHFDKDVTGVKLTLKVTKKDGKTYSVEQPFSF